jgi:tryptophan halogenase
MLKNIKNITIVGGGSAGWMTAAMLIKMFPNMNIVTIESPDVPIVGVGESTLLAMKQYADILGIDDKVFMPAADASYKLSIKFSGFGEKDDAGFHYPFGAPYTEGTYHGLRDWYLKKATNPDLPSADMARSYFPSMALIENNKFSDNTSGSFENFTVKHCATYHFDAVKFANWLRESYCKPKGVVHIPATVTHIETGDNGIEHLMLSNGNKHTSDLYIDCTGFKSLLLDGALKEEFISYENILPNNRAWATRVAYKDKERELEPFTSCTAIDNGWVWNIPLWSRIGTGYVYSDKYITPDQALEQFKQYLMSDKVVCPKSREEVDALEYRDIPMRVGIHKRLFVKNVVAIGLSAGFIEPLESNGLFSVNVFLEKLVKILSTGSINQYDKDMFNAACRNVFKNFSEFVAMHYALSSRNDTQYWEDNTNREYCNDIVDLTPAANQVGFFDFYMKRMINPVLNPSDGSIWISTGMNRPIVDVMEEAKQNFYTPVPTKQFYAQSFETMDINKTKWNKAAEKEPSLCKYLETNIFK